MALKIRNVPLADLVPDAANTRRHPEANMRTIKNSLRRFGQAEPLVIRKGTNVIIAGNGRYDAMRDLGWESCDVVELDIDSIDATALGIAMNRTGDLAAYDDHALAAALVGLDTEDPDAREAAGFTAEEMRALSDAACEFGEVGDGEMPSELAVPTKEFIAMTFLVHESQKATVDDALRGAADSAEAKEAGRENPNRNGASLVALCLQALGGA